MIRKTYKTVDTNGLRTIVNKQLVKRSCMSTVSSMVDRIYMANIFIKYSPTIRTDLEEIYKQHPPCRGCRQPITGRSWQLKHLCSTSCQILASTTCICCPTLICNGDVDHLYFFCQHCWEPTFEQHYCSEDLFPRFLLLKRVPTPSFDLECKKIIHYKVHQQSYLVETIKDLDVETASIIHTLWGRAIQSDHTCDVCTGGTRHNLFVRFQPNTPPNSIDDILDACTMVCEDCRSRQTCSTCRAEVTDRECVTAYETVQNSVCHIIYCATCFMESSPHTLCLRPIQSSPPMTTTTIITQEDISRTLQHMIQRDITTLLSTDERMFKQVTGNPVNVYDILTCLEVQHHQCSLCNNHITTPNSFKCVKQLSDYSINRINNRLPHTRSNVMVSCLGCNLNYRTCIYCNMYSMNRQDFIVFRDQTMCRDCGHQHIE